MSKNELKEWLVAVLMVMLDQRRGAKETGIAHWWDALCAVFNANHGFRG